MFPLPHVVSPLLTRTSHSTISSYSNANANDKPAHDQRGKAYQQAHFSTAVTTQSIFDGQANPASELRDLADDTAADTLSHLETLGYDKTWQTHAQAHEYTMVDETYTYELGRWAYETENLTLAERLEKGKWEAERLERL